MPPKMVSLFKIRKIVIKLRSQRSTTSATTKYTRRRQTGPQILKLSIACSKCVYLRRRSTQCAFTGPRFWFIILVGTTLGLSPQKTFSRWTSKRLSSIMIRIIWATRLMAMWQKLKSTKSISMPTKSTRACIIFTN